MSTEKTTELAFSFSILDTPQQRQHIQESLIPGIEKKASKEDLLTWRRDVHELRTSFEALSNHMTTTINRYGKNSHLVLWAATCDLVVGYFKELDKVLDQELGTMGQLAKKYALYFAAVVAVMNCAQMTLAPYPEPEQN